MEAWREELYHYGIKGMKWGVRRTPQQLGHETKRGRESRTLSKNRRIDKRDAQKKAAAALLVIGGVSVAGLAVKRWHSKNKKVTATEAEKDFLRLIMLLDAAQQKTDAYLNVN